MLVDEIVLMRETTALQLTVMQQMYKVTLIVEMMLHHRLVLRAVKFWMMLLCVQYIQHA